VKEMFSNPANSVEYFQYHLNDSVVCTNKQQLPGLTECAGYCDSTTIYTDIMRGFENDCHCCQPTATMKKYVELTCTDGSTISQPYDAATKCGCGSCRAGTEAR